MIRKSGHRFSEEIMLKQRIERDDETSSRSGRSWEEGDMKTLIGMAVVAATLAFAGPAAIAATDTAPRAKSQAAAKSDATDFSARRYYRRYYGYGYRPYYQPYPYYYARPYYYRPYPYYAPAPFPFGFGFGPFW
jgi:hypothetical protein